MKNIRIAGAGNKWTKFKRWTWLHSEQEQQTFKMTHQKEDLTPRETPDPVHPGFWWCGILLELMCQAVAVPKNKKYGLYTRKKSKIYCMGVNCLLSLIFSVISKTKVAKCNNHGSQDSKTQNAWLILLVW